AAATPAGLCARGAAAERRGEAARAHVLYDRCLAARPDRRVGEARDRLARALSAGDDGLVVIASQMPGAVVAIAPFLDGEPPLPAPVTIYLPRGRHAIRVTAPGFLPYATEIEVEGRERRTILANAP